MKYFHNIKITVFIKSEEIKEDADIEKKIITTLHYLIPLGFVKEKIQLKKQKVEGFDNRNILIFEIDLLKESHTNAFLEYFLSNITKEQKTMLLFQKESRLDENFDFFIRLEKTDLLKEKFIITDSGDCFHIKFTIAAFPKKRETALKLIDDILK